MPFFRVISFSFREHEGFTVFFSFILVLLSCVLPVASTSSIDSPQFSFLLDCSSFIIGNMPSYVVNNDSHCHHKNNSPNGKNSPLNEAFPPNPNDPVNNSTKPPVHGNTLQAQFKTRLMLVQNHGLYLK